MTRNATYGYPWEKLSAARRMLMLPHANGEAHALASAFQACSLGLDGAWPIPRDELDRGARSWVATIERTMDMTGIEDPAGRGTAIIKAEHLSHDDKQQFSEAVNDLADWLAHHYYGWE